jgi:hypothetical protein
MVCVKYIGLFSCSEAQIMVLCRNVSRLKHPPENSSYDCCVIAAASYASSASRADPALYFEH